MIKYLENVNSWEILFDILSSMLKFKEGVSVLQIGVKMKPHGVHNWQKMFKRFADYGYTYFSVLEIWEYNFNRLYGQYLNEKIFGDVRDIEKLVENKYDVIFWWHGPEHVSKEDFEKIDNTFNKFKNTIIVIGCPYGESLQGVVDGNPFEKHLYHWQPDEFEKLDYVVYTTDFNNRKDIGFVL